MSVNNHRCGVVILLENPQREIAMQLRNDPRWDHHWGLFGGWLEHSESAFTAIQREVLEELNVSLQPDKLSFQMEYDLPEIQATCSVFHYLVQHELDDTVLREGVEWRFLSLGEIIRAPVVTHHLAIIRGYYGY